MDPVRLLLTPPATLTQLLQDQNEEANSEGLISRLYRRDTGNEIVGGAVRSGGKNVNPSKAGS